MRHLATRARGRKTTRSVLPRCSVPLPSLSLSTLICWLRSCFCLRLFRLVSFESLAAVATPSTLRMMSPSCSRLPVDWRVNDVTVGGPEIPSSHAKPMPPIAREKRK